MSWTLNLYTPEQRIAAEELNDRMVEIGLRLVDNPDSKHFGKSVGVEVRGNPLPERWWAMVEELPTITINELAELFIIHPSDA